MEGIIIALVSVLVAFLVGFLLVPYMTKKGWINDKNAEMTKQLLAISKLIVKNIETDNKNVDNALLVFDVAEIAVRYVEQMAKDEPNAVKKEQAQKVVMDTLEKLNIEITNDIKALVELGIESAVNALPEDNKVRVVRL